MGVRIHRNAQGVCVHVWPTIWALIGPFQYIMDTYGQLHLSKSDGGAITWDIEKRYEALRIL